MKHPGQQYFMAAPTQMQAKKVLWRHPDCGVMRNLAPFATEINRTELFVNLVNGSQVYVVGMDQPARIEGYLWHGCLLTEFPNYKAAAWESNIRPTLADTHGFAIIEGVPDMHEPNQEQYRKLAAYACGGTIPETRPIEGAYAENPDDPEWCYYHWFSADVLSPKEMVGLRASTEPKVFSQEYEGSFITLGGRAYYAAVTEHYPVGILDKAIEYDPSLPVYIGGDFNVDPMTAVLAHHVTPTEGPNKGRVETRVFDGYYLRDSNTEQLYEQIAAKYDQTPYFVVTPCQSSRSRQTVADLGETDQTIITSVFRRHGKTVYINPVMSNPRVKDRLNLTNARLHHKLLRINPDIPALKELLADWARIVWRTGTGDLDLRDVMRGHISAALDYMEYYHFDMETMAREAMGEGARVAGTSPIF